MSSSSKGYQFTISGDSMTAIYEVERGHVKLERMDNDETWTFDGANVIQTEMDHGRLETTTYSDVNGDGLFVKASKTYSGAAGYTNQSEGHGHSSGSQPLPGVIGSSENGYQFDLATNGVVMAVHEVKHGRVEAERMDGNEAWTFDGVDVIQTETQYGKVETSIYTDANQNGLFQKAFELEVLNGANQRSLETYQFTLAGGAVATGDAAAPGDAIAGMMELGRRGWKLDRIDANETIEVVNVGADSLILKTQTQRNGEIEFSVFRDDDGDGLWSQIANGETRDVFVTLDGQVDLVGLVNAGLLQAADTLMA